MYNVSNDYLTALKSQVHVYKLRGTVQNVSFTDDDITALTLSHRISDDGETSLGSVYTAELKITFIKNLGISWANSKGWAVTFSEGLMLSDNTFEYIPAGVFYIETVEETKDGINITAYDAMMKFEKKLGDITTRARLLPALLEDICGAVHVSLANDDFSNFPNYNTVFTLSKDNDITTYRDLLSWVAQTLGAFSFINRSGALELKSYPDADNITDIINADARSDNYNFSLYTTKYTGLYITDTAKQETKYFNIEPDDGLTYNLGTNPFLQNLSAGRLNNYCMGILNNLLAVNYSPFSITLLPTLAYDFGDILRFDGGAGDSKIGCVMLYQYDYNQSITLEGLGSDPALTSAQSKTDKNLEGILKNTENNTEYVYNFANDGDIILSSDWQTIFSERFGANNNTHAIFQAEILCDDPAGSVTEVRYILDGETVDYFPVETWAEGKHILSLYYLLEPQADTFYNWVVQMRSSAAVTIDAYDGRGSIRGQGLASTEAWDGYINITEAFTTISNGNTYSLEGYTDTAAAVIIDYEPITPGDTFGTIPAPPTGGVIEYNSVLAFDGNALCLYTWDEAANHTWEFTEVNYIWGYADNPAN